MTTKDNPWQAVHTSQTESTHRMPVEGGWLYRTTVGQKPNASIAMVFVPVGLETWLAHGMAAGNTDQAGGHA